MFWLSDPRPYTTHEPRLGLASRNEPVFIITVATSCDGMSVHIDRITASSSMCFPSSGNTELTSMPDVPLRANRKGDPNPTPLRPGKSGIEVSSVFPELG